MKSVIFDLDGTLIDTLPDVVGALNRLLAENGRGSVTVEDGKHMIGEGAKPLVVGGFSKTGSVPDDAELDRLTARYIELYRAHPVVDSVLFPGVMDALDALRYAGVPLGVCTNKPAVMTGIVLDAFGMSDYFGSVIAGDSLPIKKPDPAHLFAVVEALGVEAAGTVYVGDSPTDVKTAKAAGIPVVVVRFGYSKVAVEELGAEALIGHYDELIPAIETLTSPAQETA